MATASTNASAASEHSSVQPSATLIEALRFKLCDPSIVSEFERCRSPHVTQRLITPRWVLKSYAEDVVVADGADCKAAGSNSDSSKEGSAQKSSNDSPTSHHQNGQETKNNNELKFNTVPQRNYLDIRIEQNTIFANEQCLRCQKKLAALSSTSPKSAEAINVNKKQIKKVIDSIQNHLNEGLAACPNHDGLLLVEPELKLWMDRINGVVVVNGSSDSSSAVIDTATAAVVEGRDANNTIDLLLITSTQQTAMKRKGAEGRAQAAIDDALVERMFLQGDDDNGDSNSAGAVDTNNNFDDLKWVPPASRVDESAPHERRGEDPSDSDSDHGRKRRRHKQRRIHYRSKSRTRSRSAESEEDRRRKGKRKHRHRDRSRVDRKHKRRRNRSRSRSMSRGRSSSSASLASRSISKDRTKRKHRRDRHHSHKRRHKSSRSRRKGRKSSRRHRSRRERSRSVSSSLSHVAVGADDDIKGRFEPPTLSQQKPEEMPLQTLQREGMEKRFVPPSNNGAPDEIQQREEPASMRQISEVQHVQPEAADATGKRFVPRQSSSNSKLSNKNEVPTAFEIVQSNNEDIHPKKSNGALSQKQSAMQRRFVPKGKVAENCKS
jgi:hypothetical protein